MSENIIFYMTHAHLKDITTTTKPDPKYGTQKQSQISSIANQKDESSRLWSVFWMTFTGNSELFDGNFVYLEIISKL